MKTMDKNVAISTIVGALVALVIFYGPWPRTSEPKAGVGTLGDGQLYVYYDRQAGIACYRHSATRGIACAPMKNAK